MDANTLFRLCVENFGDTIIEESKSRILRLMQESPDSPELKKQRATTGKESKSEKN